MRPQYIRITPSVPDGQQTRGPVDIGFTISSTSKKPCTFTALSSDLLAVISAGRTAIWDSTVCKTALLTEPGQVSPGWSTVVPVEWSGRGSGPACSKKEGWATPGSYTVQVGTLGGEPGKAKFTLQPAPKPKTTDDEEKKSDARGGREARDEEKTDERTERLDVPLEDARLREPGQALAHAPGPQVADAFDGLEVVDAGGQQLLQRCRNGR